MKGKKILVIISILLVLFLSLGITGLFTKNKLEKEKNKQTTTPVVEKKELIIPDDAVKLDIPVVEIEDLNKKLEQFAFADINYSRVVGGQGNIGVIEKSGDTIFLRLANFEVEKVLKITSLPNAKSLAMIDIGPGQISYILCDDGFLYYSVDINKEVVDNENYEPVVTRALTVPIESMAVGKIEQSIIDNDMTRSAFIYLKTMDGRILTTEFVSNGNEQAEFVELVEKNTKKDITE